MAAFLSSHRRLTALAATYFFATAIASSAVQGDEQTATRLFSSDPLFPAWWSAFEGQLTIEIERLEYGAHDLGAIALDMQVTPSGVTIDKASSKYAGGELALSLGYDFSTRSLELHAQGQAIAIEQSGWRANGIAAPIELKIDITANGSSMRAIAASANGTFTGDVGSGVLPNSTLGHVGDDLFMHALSRLNPFNDSEENTPFECAKFRLEIDQGQVHAEHVAALQLRDLILSCGGRIDLAREYVDGTCRPQQLNTGLLSAESAVESIGVEGALTELEVSVATAKLLRQGASFGQGITSVAIPNFGGLLGQSSRNAECTLDF